MKRGTPRHPKVSDLASRLKIPRWGAVGILEMLWHFTAEFALQGDIGRFSDEAIASALCYDGPSTELVSALVDSGWVDRCECHRLKVHDWPDHADQTVERVLAKRNQCFLQCYDNASIVLVSSCENVSAGGFRHKALGNGIGNGTGGSKGEPETTQDANAAGSTTCSTTGQPDLLEPEHPKSEQKFTPPSLEDVKKWAQENGIQLSGLDIERFHDFYTSKGWMVGKNKMKCWRAALRNWSRSHDNRVQTPNSILKTSSERNFFCEDAWNKPHP